MGPLEFELTYYDSAVLRSNHGDTRAAIVQVVLLFYKDSFDTK